MQKNNFVSLFFLFGIAALPFFNDFPYLISISPGFRDISLPLFLLGTVTFLIKFALMKDVKCNKIALTFFLLMTCALSASLFVNIATSIEVCGDFLCSFDRMRGAYFSDLIKFFFVVPLVYVIDRVGVKEVCRYARMALYVTFAYVSCELVLSYIPYTLGFNTSDWMVYLDQIFHIRVNNWGPNRTRGFAFEPGYQGVVLICLLPFILSDDFYKRRNINLFLWLSCLITAWAAGSIFAALIFFLIYKSSNKVVTNIKYLIYFIFVTFVVFHLINFEKIIIEDNFISTITRIGSMISALLVSINNPFFGVGPGMSGYFVSTQYPDFFFLSPESNDWLSLGINSFDAPTFSSWLTFSANYGIMICLIIFTFLYFSGVLNNILKSNIGRATFFAYFIIGFTISTYQFMGFLLFLALSIGNNWAVLDKIRATKSA